jgi:small subunit ribosomal protein S11
MTETNTTKSAPKKKIKTHVRVGVVHIKATFNNFIVTITDLKGNVLDWSSSGKCQFKGAKKSTPYAAQVVIEKLVPDVKDKFGVETVSILVKGPGAGRETAIRTLAKFVEVASIKDITPIPHNGCRPRKRRRV